MKRSLVIFLSLVFMILGTSCGNDKSAKPTDTLKPEVSQMKMICELATMECFYHNVAKYKEEDASGYLLLLIIQPI